MYFLQLPLFKKTAAELETDTDKWFFFLRNLPDLSQIPAIFKEAIFQKAFKMAEIAALSYAEQVAYQLSIDQRSIWESSQELKFDQGFEQGKEAGRAEAKAKLVEAETKTTAIAQRLKARGLSDAEIAEITGLPPEGIPRL
jgi:predicted transposase/invertase (TIGR01784 family)